MQQGKKRPENASGRSLVTFSISTHSQTQIFWQKISHLLTDKHVGFKQPLDV